jgi:hypothetical protein
MDRREYQRFNVPLLANIERGNRTIVARAGNASLNGLLLLAEETIADNEIVTIKMPLTEFGMDAVIQCVGTVVRHVGGAIGVHISADGSESFLCWRRMLYGPQTLALQNAAAPAAFVR